MTSRSGSTDVDPRRVARCSKNNVAQSATQLSHQGSFQTATTNAPTTKIVFYGSEEEDPMGEQAFLQAEFLTMVATLGDKIRVEVCDLKFANSNFSSLELLEAILPNTQTHEWTIFIPYGRLLDVPRLKQILNVRNPTTYRALVLDCMLPSNHVQSVLRIANTPRTILDVNGDGQAVIHVCQSSASSAQCKTMLCNSKWVSENHEQDSVIRILADNAFHSVLAHRSWWQEVGGLLRKHLLISSDIEYDSPGGIIQKWVAFGISEQRPLLLAQPSPILPPQSAVKQIVLRPWMSALMLRQVVRLENRCFPIFILVRDRLHALYDMIHSLRPFWANVHVILVDLNSQYRPLIQWMCNLEMRFPNVSICWTSLNHIRDVGKQVITPFMKRRFPNHANYIVSDSDCLLEGIPEDGLEVLQTILQRHPDFNRVGFDMRTDDVPDCYPLAAHVRALYERHRTRHLQKVIPIRSGLRVTVHERHIASTFAMYRSDYIWTHIHTESSPYHDENGNIIRSFRTHPPYVVRHWDWYQDGAKPVSDDVKMYLARSVPLDTEPGKQESYNRWTSWWIDPNSCPYGGRNALLLPSNYVGPGKETISFNNNETRDDLMKVYASPEPNLSVENVPWSALAQLFITTANTMKAVWWLDGGVLLHAYRDGCYTKPLPRPFCFNNPSILVTPAKITSRDMLYFGTPNVNFSMEDVDWPMFQQAFQETCRVNRMNVQIEDACEYIGRRGTHMIQLDDLRNGSEVMERHPPMTRSAVNSIKVISEPGQAQKWYIKVHLWTKTKTSDSREVLVHYGGDPLIDQIAIDWISTRKEFKQVGPFLSNVWCLDNIAQYLTIRYGTHWRTPMPLVCRHGRIEHIARGFSLHMACPLHLPTDPDLDSPPT